MKLLYYIVESTEDSNEKRNTIKYTNNIHSINNMHNI